MTTPSETVQEAAAGVHRPLMLFGAALVVVAAAMSLQQSEQLMLVGCLVGVIILTTAYKLDYLNPAVAYLAPWLTIMFFSTVPISQFSRDLGLGTARILLTMVFTWLVAVSGAPVNRGSGAAALELDEEPQPEFSSGFGAGIFVAFMILYAFAALNVVVSGYIPLFALFGGGRSGYAEFGIPSVYGAFLAYSNALGCLAFYANLRTGRRVYLLLFLSVLAMQLVFVTRQNMATLLVEAFVIRCIAVGRISGLKIVALLAAGLVGFALIGELRSGGIRDLIRVEPEYLWMPASLLWLYAYSYFNILNLDNMITQSGAPFFDGGMWATLLPSVLRPDIDTSSYLEVASMTVSSYAYPVYMDVGPVGLMLFTALLGFLTARAYRRALQGRRFIDLAVYACLFYCASMSFFTNFWLYLPVIFQLVFFWLFHRLLFARDRAGAGEMHSYGAFRG